jgi:hypothetical protein
MASRQVSKCEIVDNDRAHSRQVCLEKVAYAQKRLSMFVRLVQADPTHVGQSLDWTIEAAIRSLHEALINYNKSKAFDAEPEYEEEYDD